MDSCCGSSPIKRELLSCSFPGLKYEPGIQFMGWFFLGSKTAKSYSGQHLWILNDHIKDNGSLYCVPSFLQNVLLFSSYPAIILILILPITAKQRTFSPAKQIIQSRNFHCSRPSSRWVWVEQSSWFTVDWINGTVVLSFSNFSSTNIVWSTTCANYVAPLGQIAHDEWQGNVNLTLSHEHPNDPQLNLLCCIPLCWRRCSLGQT